MSEFIYLNKINSGSYLKEHIGYEIINYINANDGNRYIYIAPYGKRIKCKKGDHFKVMFIEKQKEKGLFEVIFAFDSNDIIKGKNINTKNVSYFGKNLEKIMSKNIENDVFQSPNIAFATYNIGSLYKPKVKIFLNNTTNIYTIDGAKVINTKHPGKSSYNDELNFGRHSYFLYKENDKPELNDLYLSLNGLLSFDKSEWEICTDTNFSDIESKNKSYPLSLLEKTKNINNEISCTKYLVYILKKYKNCTIEFFNEKLNTELNSNYVVFNEKGNMDITIVDKDRKYAIVIENKIDSDIHDIELNNENTNIKSQLSKYIDENIKKVLKQVFGDKNTNDIKKYFFIFVPNSSRITESYLQKFKYGSANDTEHYILIKYGDLLEFYKSKELDEIDKQDFLSFLYYHSLSKHEIMMRNFYLASKEVDDN